MLLVDTSVWIDFFGDKGSLSAQWLDAKLSSNERICINAVVEMEILQGIRHEKTYLKIKSFLSDFQYYPGFNQPYFEMATSIYRQCRKRGITIRKSLDCLISANCILDNLTVVHKDRDFSNIAEVFPKLNALDLRS